MPDRPGKMLIFLRKTARFIPAVIVLMLFVTLSVGVTFSFSNLPEKENGSIVSSVGKEKKEFILEYQDILVDAAPTSDILEIFLKGADGENITGCLFQTIIETEDGSKQILVDEDKDGVISISKPDPGLYKIKLLKYGNYNETDTIEVTVEKPVEHKKVDVSSTVKKQSEVDVANDDSQYGGNKAGGDSSSSSSDTVELVDSEQEQVGTQTVDKALTDADGHQLYGSVPKMSEADENGYRYIYDCAGNLTDIRVTVDENGYLVKAEQGFDDEYSECTYSVIDQYGHPICDSDGEPDYQFENIVALTTTEDEPVYKYTGWQEIDGNIYYYDKNGNKVTGLQVIGGLTYFFDSNGVRETSMGIDVSTWNVNIDWNAVKNAGIDFVIVRTGFRGYGSGSLVEDDEFYSHINGALEAGLKVGAYFFTQAISEQEAVEEASMCIDMVSGYDLTYPIFIDMEDAGSSHARTNGLSNSQRTAIINAFCDTIRSAGYRAGLYANKYYLESKINTDQLNSGTVIWLAHYVSKSSYSGHYEMWQYSATGNIDGVPGHVDLNIGYLGY